MDTVRLIAQQRNFYTADVELAAFGRVMLVGDEAAVERLLAIIAEHGGHDLKLLPSEE